jgi:hypothetical protein
MNEHRKLRREQLIMERRGLNFLTDDQADNLDLESIMTIEQEVDNIAPKVVAIMGLNEFCDTERIKSDLIEHCK